MFRVTLHTNTLLSLYLLHHALADFHNLLSGSLYSVIKNKVFSVDASSLQTVNIVFSILTIITKHGIVINVQ
jgi:hypothetical protein